MKLSPTCKRGSVHPPRDRHGHCRCELCKEAAKAGRSDRSAYQKAWQSANRSKCAGYSKKWNDANKEKRRSIEQAWKEANPDKLAEYSRRAGKKWAATNKGKRLASVRMRQLAKRMRTPAWADTEALKAFYIEAAEKTKLTGIAHEVDHVLPLQGETVSGLHVPENLRVITRHENRSKGINLCAA